MTNVIRVSNQFGFVRVTQTNQQLVINQEQQTVVVNQAGAQGAAGATDHGALTGLADDDHAQYHNDTRGDARYYTQAQVTSLLSGKANTSHTHVIADTTGLQAALDSKEASITAGTTAQYWRGDKSFQTLDKTAVGLGNVDNTSDANKPVSTATQTALDLKANLASPTFTGTVTLPAGQVVNGVTLSTAQGTGNFLRGDGAYASAGGTPAGADTQIQYNNSGAFGASANLTWNSTTGNLISKGTTGEIQSTYTTVGTTAKFSSYSTLVDYPRAVFTLGRESGTTLTNTALWVVPAGTSQITTTLEALTNFDSSLTATKRIGMRATTTEALIYFGRAGGTDGDQPMAFSTNGVAAGTRALYILAPASNQKVGVYKATPVGQLHVQSATSSIVSEIVQGATSQTANLTEWQDSSAAVLTYIGADGTIKIPNNINIVARNAANSANLNILKMNTSNKTELDGYNELKLMLAGSHQWSVDGVGFFPSVNNLLDIGKSGANIQTLYVATSIISNTGKFLLKNTNLGIQIWCESAGRDIDLATENIIQWKIKGTTGNLEAADSQVIRMSTSDAADNDSLTLTAGGAAGNTRGGTIYLYGNEHATTGSVVIEAGNIIGGDVLIKANNTELLSVKKSGLVGVNKAIPAGQLHTQSISSSTITGIDQGATGQTANLREWQDNSATVLSFVAADGNMSVPDEVYGAGWNGSLEVPTKNALYDKIETLTGVSDGDKGDITVTASGATWTIDNDAVTYAKIQDVSATDKILGRSTAGAGIIEEITCTAQARALLDDTTAHAQRNTLRINAAILGMNISLGV